jgi:xylulokinase
MTRLIGLDVGTSGLKAVAVSPEQGAVTEQASVGYELAMPQPGWTEQDPDDWWHAAERAMGELGGPDVAGIGVSGQMHGMVLLDAAMRPLRPALLWNDGRTGSECAEIERRIGRERLIELTGNRAATGFTAPKLLWVRAHEPDVWARIRHVMLPKDYVRFRLTGELATDVSDASGTLLFDVARRRWSEEVLEALEIPPGWLPAVHESTEPAGRRGEAAVAAGAGDQAAAAAGLGIVRPGPASVVLGTSGVVFTALDGYRYDPAARLHTFCHARPGGWHAMGVMLAAASSLRWFRESVAGGLPHGALDDEAAEWPPGSGGLLFLPYLSGERTPHNDPDARAALIGLGLEHDRGAIARAVMEGVAYGLRDSVELLAELGDRPAAGRLSGGGAGSSLWRRITASVLGMPLERTVTEEGSAYGAALLGGVAAGVFDDLDDAVARCVRVADRVDPDPEWAAAYAAGYERFRRGYPAVRPL